MRGGVELCEAVGVFADDKATVNAGGGGQDGGRCVNLGLSHDSQNGRVIDWAWREQLAPLVGLEVFCGGAWTGGQSMAGGDVDEPPR